MLHLLDKVSDHKNGIIRLRLLQQTTSIQLADLVFWCYNFMSHKAIGTTKYTHHNHANTTQQLPSNPHFLLHSIPWSGIGIPAQYAAVVVAFANVGSQNCEPPPQHTAPVRR